jgi:hypothetical protein
MRRPARVPVNRQQKATVKSIPAPVGGLNARDALADMDEKDAVTLDNVFPESNYAVLRRGYETHRTGCGGSVQSLLVYRASTGSDTLFACANNKIWNVTSPGSAATEVASGFTSNRWQYANFETPGGLFLMAVNGANAPQIYNASVFAAASISASGLTVTTLVNVTQHKERLWFVQKDTMNLWYLPTQAIAGTLVKFPMGAVFKKGGFIQSFGSFSTDSGDGPDDFFAIISSEGEVAVYAGTDPASSATWGLVGLFPTGKPVGRRCSVEISGDLIWITTDGAVSMQRLLRFDRSQAERAAVTAKINSLFSEQIESYGSNTGWEGLVYPERRYLMVNIPTASDSTAVQLVMNTITGAWCRFTGLNAVCWATANGELYFGDGSGRVWQADVTRQDNGGVIQGDVKTAFNYLGKRGANKQWTMIRPILASNGAPGFSVGLDTDFGTDGELGEITTVEGSAAVWGSSQWGAAQWGGGDRLTKYWQTVGGVGFAGAIKFRVRANGQSCTINSFDVAAIPGGPM